MATKTRGDHAPVALSQHPASVQGGAIDATKSTGTGDLKFGRRARRRL
jgi:hypothetical protein